MSKIRALNRDIMNREEAKEVMKVSRAPWRCVLEVGEETCARANHAPALPLPSPQVYTATMSSLDDYEHQKVEEWGADVERSSQSKLKLPLLTRTKEGDSEIDAQLLAVNFDPALVRLLREVKYFLLLGLEVPATALEIYKKAETFRRQTGNLDIIVSQHNQMMIGAPRVVARRRRRIGSGTTLSLPPPARPRRRDAPRRGAAAQGAAHEDRPDARARHQGALVEEPVHRLVHRRRAGHRQGRLRHALRAQGQPARGRGRDGGVVQGARPRAQVQAHDTRRGA